MKNEAHFRALERMCRAAPINEIFKPQIGVSEGAAEIEIEVRETLFHAAGAVHGSVYFKSRIALAETPGYRDEIRGIS